LADRLDGVNGPPIARRGRAWDPELLEVVKAHGYDLARRLGRLPDPGDVAADWYDHVYRPGVAAVERAGLPAVHPYKTEADLFLWVYERRRDLRVFDPEAGFDAAAAHAAREGVGRRDRRVIEQETAKPLNPSTTPGSSGAPRWRSLALLVGPGDYAGLGAPGRAGATAADRLRQKRTTASAKQTSAMGPNGGGWAPISSPQSASRTGTEVGAPA
jgi:hypothetical protein